MKNVHSHEQRMAALAKANRVRCHHAEWKRRLRTKNASLTDVMGDPLTDSMRVVQALLALPHVGRVKANRSLRAAGVAPAATLGSLTYRQRVELARRFH